MLSMHVSRARKHIVVLVCYTFDRLMQKTLTLAYVSYARKMWKSTKYRISIHVWYTDDISHIDK